MPPKKNRRTDATSNRVSISPPASTSASVQPPASIDSMAGVLQGHTLPAFGLYPRSQGNLAHGERRSHVMANVDQFKAFEAEDCTPWPDVQSSIDVSSILSDLSAEVPSYLAAKSLYKLSGVRKHVDLGVEGADEGFTILEAAVEEDDNLKAIESQEKPRSEVQGNAALLGELQRSIRHFNDRSEEAKKRVLGVFTIMREISSEPGLQGFVDAYAGVLRKKFREVENASGERLYELGPDGLLLPKGSVWGTYFGDIIQLRIQCRERLEGFMSLLYKAFQTNAHTTPILDALKEEADLAELKHLLFTNPADVKDCEEHQVVYALSPSHWLRRGVIRAINESHDYREAKVADLPASDQPVYAGMTGDPVRRLAGHLLSPVNKRVAAAMEEQPSDRWTMAVVFDFHDSSRPDRVFPALALHFVEHSLFVLFHLTIPTLGGLNINLFDGEVRITKIRSSSLRKVIRTIEGVLSRDSRLRIPMPYDTEAWQETLRLILGGDALDLRAREISQMVLGTSREKVFEGGKWPRLEKLGRTIGHGTGYDLFWTPMSPSSFKAVRPDFGHGLSQHTEWHLLRAYERWLSLVSDVVRDL